jgi:ABC-type transport system substrate-binding protein
MRSSSRCKGSSRGPFLAVAVLLVSLLVACEPAGEPPIGRPTATPSASSSPVETPEPGGAIAFGVIGEPATLDPYSPVASDLTYQLLRPVYPTLYRIDPDGHFQPDLARGWKPVNDGIEIELQQRRWSNGRAITAQDVALSFARQANADSGPFGPAAGARAPRVQVSVTGPRTLVVRGSRLRRPAFGSPLFVLPEGRLNLSISGGPYKIADYTPGLQVVYSRNDAGPGKPPLLDRVAVKFVETFPTLLALLEDAKLDAAAPPSAVNLGDRLDGAGIEHDSTLGWESIAVDFDEAQIDEPPRAAVARAINRAAIDEGLVRDEGRISNTLLPGPGGSGARGQWRTPSGSGSPPAVQIAVSKGDELLEQMQEVVQLQLEDAGGSAELVTGDTRTFYGEWRSSSPTDLSILRMFGSQAASLGTEQQVLFSTQGMPLFQVETFVAWQEDIVQGLVPNPSIEGPLWNMQSWAKV